MLDFWLQEQADNVWLITFTARGERKKSHTAGLSIRGRLQWIGTSQKCSNLNVFVSSQEWVSSSVLQLLLKPLFESWKAVNPPIEPDFTRSAKSRWWRPWSVCCRWVATVIPWYSTVKDPQDLVSFHLYIQWKRQTWTVRLFIIILRCLEMIKEVQVMLQHQS